MTRRKFFSVSVLLAVAPAVRAASNIVQPPPSSAPEPIVLKPGEAFKIVNQEGHEMFSVEAKEKSTPLPDHVLRLNTGPYSFKMQDYD